MKPQVATLIAMRTVGIRELKNRLSEFLRLVQQGEVVLVTDRGRVIAELRQPTAAETATPYPLLARAALEGKVRQGAPNRPDLYVRMGRPAGDFNALEMLEESRGDR